VVWGLLTAFAAAWCYALGSIFQAIAARSVPDADGLDPRFLIRLLHSWRYLLGVGLDGVGFLLSLVAVRALPLFVVQSVVASFLAITAVLGAVFLKMPLRRSDRIGLGVVVAGLVLVGASAAEDSSVDVSDAERWGVLVVAVLLALVAIPLARVPGVRGAFGLGAVAGLAFGATAVASRMLPGDLDALLTSPATYALIVAGIVAMLTYSIALQRGSVTQATAPLVVGETVAPALVGILLLGDHTRPGWGWVALLGFVVSVGGAISLARHGEVEVEVEVGQPRHSGPRPS
jgi:drug/metabolite transporter (DMT)-like permease